MLQSKIIAALPGRWQWNQGLPGRLAPQVAGTPRLRNSSRSDTTLPVRRRWHLEFKVAHCS